jgi:hypothetical protein
MIAERGLHYSERIAAAKAGEKEKQQFEKVKDDLVPLLRRFDKATRDWLLPGLKDGQGALVFDAQLVAPQWHPAMPPAARPLPFPELAYVVGVSDKELVRKAVVEYYDLALESQRLAIKANPDGAPLAELPEPAIEEGEDGTTATFDLPPQWMLDRRIAPCAGLGDRAAVLAFAPETVKRLLKPRPVQLDGPLANVERPLAGVSRLNFVRLLEMFEPWIDYAIDHSGNIPNIPNLTLRPRAESPVAVADEEDPAKKKDPEKKDDDEKPEAPPPRFEPEQAKAQARIIFSFLKCYRGSTSITYQEEKALVTHSEWHYEDFPN